MGAANHRPCSAVSYVIADLTVRYPEGIAEVYMQARQGSSRVEKLVAVRALRPCLAQFCGALPFASVRYEPEHPYGLVAVLRCACAQPPKCCAKKCPAGATRPFCFDSHTTAPKT
jgi:hypothetical protein